MGLTSCKHNECEQVSVQSDVMAKVGKATFSEKCDLTKHQATYSGRTSCKCLENKKTFTCKSDLTVHHSTHHQKKDHVCIQCEKPFSTKSSLTIHQRIHTGEKPCGCSDCIQPAGKSQLSLYTGELTLGRNHRSVKSVEKPF